MGGVKLEALKEAQHTKLIPFSTRDRIEQAANGGEAGMRAMLMAIEWQLRIPFRSGIRP